MASKEQIKMHLAMTTQLNFDYLPKLKGDDPRKQRILEHVRKSRG